MFRYLLYIILLGLLLKPITLITLGQSALVRVSRYRLKTTQIKIGRAQLGGINFDL